MNTTNFYDLLESVDMKYLNFLNSKTGWWTSVTQTALFAHTDAIAEDAKGNKYYIELKERFISPYSFNDLFIEPLKVRELESKVKDGVKSLYINFFNKGKEIFIWNFSKPLTKSFRPNVKIWDKGANSYKYQDRYGLYKDEAIHLVYDETIQNFVIQ